MSRRSHAASAAALVASLAVAVSTFGCSDSTSPGQRDVPTAVHVLVANTVLVDGDTATASAVVIGKQGDTLALALAPVTWSTTDAGAVTVNDSSGLVTAIGQGSAWVVASSGEARDSVQLMVDYRRISADKPFVRVTLYSQSFTHDDGCALTAAGLAYCWGADNRYGQLGDGSTEASPTPVAVAGDFTFKELYAGSAAACGLTTADGTLYCWGRNTHAQFGTGSVQPRQSLVPTAGAGELRFDTMSLSTDGSTCGVSTADGVLYCWGNDTYFTTGKELPATVTTDLTVAPVTGSLVATQVQVSDYHGCAISADRAAWCWGNGETFGLSATVKAPTRVTEPDALASVSVGVWATCGLTAGGQALCWGYPPVAPGADASAPVTSPTAVAGALRFKKLSVGVSDFACGLTTDGDVYCWGSGSGPDANGALGRPGSAPASAPVQVLPGRKFVDVEQSCAVDVAGDVYCWY